tara:strand:- start:315 stop:512 length:198 start_codon:yes stop_codon:yes gene_type:complete
MSVMVFSNGEPNVRTNISMVVIPLDGDNVSHRVVHGMESLVEELMIELLLLIVCIGCFWYVRQHR